MSIDASNAKLGIDSEMKESEFNPTNEIVNIKLHTLLYIGGYNKKLITLPEELRGRMGLNGCVSSVSIASNILVIVENSIQSFLSSWLLWWASCISWLQVKLFGMEVKHTQLPSDSANVHDCFLTFGDICEKDKPCMNNGQCVPIGTQSYTCDCQEEYG